MSEKKTTTRPVIETKLRHNILSIPEEARRASGIVVFGRRIKTLVFTTDVAIIRNCDADAVFGCILLHPRLPLAIPSSSIPTFRFSAG